VIGFGLGIAETIEPAAMSVLRARSRAGYVAAASSILPADLP
jgi:hypothetical protein